MLRITQTPKGFDSEGATLELYPYHKKHGALFYAMRADDYFEIVTPNGTMTGSPGDYIVRGHGGWFFAVTKETFESEYEETGLTSVTYRSGPLANVD